MARTAYGHTTITINDPMTGAAPVEEVMEDAAGLFVEEHTVEYKGHGYFVRQVSGPSKWLGMPLSTYVDLLRIS